jgi:two-component system, NarL family, response regulator LiaR
MITPISVLIVDDHAVVRRGVRAFLETLPDIQVAGEAANGQEAVDAVSLLAPDVVLLDLVMPGMDGVEAARLIKKTSPRTLVIVLTSYYDDEFIFPAIHAGALSYLLKDASPDELAEAIRLAARGEAVLHPRVAVRLVKELSGAPAHLQNPFQELTARELEVLRLIADGLSNQEIAGSLVISEKTVKSHVTSILSKLHLADRTQAAVYAWQEGLVRRNT